MMTVMKIPQILNRRNRILLKELTKTDFKLRYQGSVLGYLWALLRPMMLFAILYFVFTKVFRFGDGIPHYAVYLLTGVVLWNFFMESTNQGIQAIVGRGDLIRKISFPKWIVVVSATATALINFAINLAVIIAFALMNGVTPNFGWILILPFVVELYLLSLGISMLLGAINVKYRDISSIWEVLMQAVFYAVPIIYPISFVMASSVTLAKILMLNPIAQAVQDIRYWLVTKEAVRTWDLIGNIGIKSVPILIVLMVLVLASAYFRKRSKRFAEEI